jgi:DNA-binding SARP family transcriptional activator
MRCAGRFVISTWGAVDGVSVPARRQGDRDPPRLQILGPLRLWHGGTEASAGPRQQSYLLALLLARAGHRISTGELAELIWGEDAPATALNVIHKYIGNLRRILEPSLPARAVGSYLLRQSNGYLFVADAAVLDLVAFRKLVEIARDERRPDVALDRYVEALRLWHGAAGDGLTLGPEAMSIFAGLNSEFLAAATAAAEVALSLDRADLVLTPLELAASLAPLHEPVHAALVMALNATGQQAAALSVFHRVRTSLADELGIAPGDALRESQRRVLQQGVTVLPAPTVVAEPDAPVPAPLSGLIGRAEEMRLCGQIVTTTVDGGTGLLLVEGEPGVGKTRLLVEIAAEAGPQGALVVWGRCLDGDGTPSMWPWTQVFRALLETLPPTARRPWQDGDLGRLVEPREDSFRGTLSPDNRAQFRVFEQAVALVAAVATAHPLVVIVDDLQWADVASLHLFRHLTARPAGRTMIVGAFRDRAPAPGPDLLRLLSAASRVPGHRRIRLGPLHLADVAELVHRETGVAPDDEDVRRIHARTAGNPFFVREVTRSAAGFGAHAAGRTAVPLSVRDVIRDRVARLDQDSVVVLRTAALIGLTVDLGLLAGAAGLDVQVCLDRVEPLVELGLLESAPGDPYSFRFAHDLVRESVVGMTPQRQAARLHLSVADALERLEHQDDATAERLAHHLRSAGPFADPGRAARALLRGAHRAMTKTALEAAERHLTSAAQVARSAGLDELELTALTQLTTVSRMRGYRSPAAESLDRAEHLARSLGRDREAADILFTRVVKASQTAQPDRGRLARRMMDWGKSSPIPIVRACGLQAWGLHQWDLGNITEAHHHLDQAHRTLMDEEHAADEDNPLRHDLLMVWPMMQAVVTALHGDVDQARRLLDEVETAAGDKPYAVTISSHYSGTVASMIDDPVWAARMVERWLASDPQDYAHVDGYLHITRCWARARTGDDPAGAAAEAREIMATLLDPPRWGISFNYALVGEMLLEAGEPVEAGAVLDLADHYLDVFGQRYAEGLLLLLRARALHATGAPPAAVRDIAERARTLSAGRGAYLFARRAESFLADLQ